MRLYTITSNPNHRLFESYNFKNTPIDEDEYNDDFDDTPSEVDEEAYEDYNSDEDSYIDNDDYNEDYE